MNRIRINLAFKKRSFIGLLKDGRIKIAMTVLEVIFPHSFVFVAILPLKRALATPDSIY